VNAIFICRDLIFKEKAVKVKFREKQEKLLKAQTPFLL